MENRRKVRQWKKWLPTLAGTYQLWLLAQIAIRFATFAIWICLWWWWCAWVDRREAHKKQKRIKCKKHKLRKIELAATITQAHWILGGETNQTTCSWKFEKVGTHTDVDRKRKLSCSSCVLWRTQPRTHTFSGLSFGLNAITIKTARIRTIFIIIKLRINI